MGASPRVRVRVALEETGRLPPLRQPTGRRCAKLESWAPFGVQPTMVLLPPGARDTEPELLLCPSEAPVSIQRGELREECLTGCLTGGASGQSLPLLSVGSLSGDQHPHVPCAHIHHWCQTVFFL